MKRRNVTPLITALDAEAHRRATAKLTRYFPDCTPRCQPGSRQTEDHQNLDGTQRWCRVLYPKPAVFMAEGKHYRERCFMAGNRVGKSDLGAFETTLHLTGRYPPWWTGREFHEPVHWWAAGDTAKTTRNIIQEKLLGPPTALGTGFIPAHLLADMKKKAGVANAYETIWVTHASGGTSTVELKSYDQRRESFQGTAQHGIWLDEEPPMDIYTECLLRTMATADFPGGIIILTFTPLLGHTELVRSFLRDADRVDVAETA